MLVFYCGKCICKEVCRIESHDGKNNVNALATSLEPVREIKRWDHRVGHVHIYSFYPKRLAGEQQSKQKLYKTLKL